MPQLLLPILPPESTSISPLLGICVRGNECTYYLGQLPVFTHDQNDLANFRMITSQMIIQGHCTQADIVRAFGVSYSSVKRAVKRYREQGVGGFFAVRKTRGASVLVDEVRARAQMLLDAGVSRKQVCEQLDVKKDCLRKAIACGRLHVPEDVPEDHGQVVGSLPDRVRQASNASERAALDADAAMGVACTHVVERVLAATGHLAGVSPRFAPCRDVCRGGVLAALPALLSNGLLSHLQECFSHFKPKYYTLDTLVVLLAFMALCRLKHIERMRFESPGEWGKLLGMDRSPEVRVIRAKLAQICREPDVAHWAALLSSDWMQSDPQAAGTLYMDGHVRVYHGEKTPLPKRYVSRQRLCMRGITDYYINDVLGRPFFVVEKQIDDGLINTLRNDVVPRLLQDVPSQPTCEQLQDNPHLSRFTIVFDREGYSPKLFRELWREHRIAAMTYHKYPKDAWPQHEFKEYSAVMPNGETVCMMLAERGSRIGSGKEALWVREVRKLTQTEHQTALISTAFNSNCLQDAVYMFSRWVQENFFAYMKKHYGIDGLLEHNTQQFPDPKTVVNPEYRQLQAKAKKIVAHIARTSAQYLQMEINPQEDERKLQKKIQKMAEYRETVELLDNELKEIKAKCAQIPKHIELNELPNGAIRKLSSNRKHFIETIKLIAYRAETAMAMMLRPKLGRIEDARPLICELMQLPADLYPDMQNNILHIHIHPPATKANTKAIQQLLRTLNDTQTQYPGTHMTMQYKLIGNQTESQLLGSDIFPTDQFL